MQKILDLENTLNGSNNEDLASQKFAGASVQPGTNATRGWLKRVGARNIGFGVVDGSAVRR